MRATRIRQMIYCAAITLCILSATTEAHADNCDIDVDPETLYLTSFCCYYQDWGIQTAYAVNEDEDDCVVTAGPGYVFYGPLDVLDLGANGTGASAGIFYEVLWEDTGTYGWDCSGFPCYGLGFVYYSAYSVTHPLSTTSDEGWADLLVW